jgi:uncharacterized SAM-binding protein YcdF (DUF218 family)
MSRLISLLFLPPLSIILLLIVGVLLWRKWRRLSFFIITVATFLFVTLTTPIVPSLALRWIESSAAALPLNNSIPAADAIVVLGAGIYNHAPEYGEDTVKNSALERLRYAARLYRLTKKAVLLSGGGTGQSGSTEAEVMRKVLVEDFSVPVRWLEQKSINTDQNARESAEILFPMRIKKIYLITHAAHMRRAIYSFEKVGFAVVPAPMGFLTTSEELSNWRNWLPSHAGLDLSYIAVHELIGILWYRWGGR